MEPINIRDFREGLQGRPFRSLIQHHLNSQSPADRLKGFNATLLLLPSEVQPTVEAFIDQWNERARDRELWETDCAAIFDEIVGDARLLVRQLGVVEDDDTLFNMFQVVTLNYAYSADHERSFRQFTGLTKPGVRRTLVWRILVALLLLVVVNVTDHPAVLVGGWILFGLVGWQLIRSARR